LTRAHGVIHGLEWFEAAGGQWVCGRGVGSVRGRPGRLLTPRNGPAAGARDLLGDWPLNTRHRPTDGRCGKLLRRGRRATTRGPHRRSDMARTNTWSGSTGSVRTSAGRHAVPTDRPLRTQDQALRTSALHSEKKVASGRGGGAGPSLRSPKRHMENAQNLVPLGERHRLPRRVRLHGPLANFGPGRRQGRARKLFSCYRSSSRAEHGRASCCTATSADRTGRGGVATRRAPPARRQEGPLRVGGSVLTPHHLLTCRFI